MQKPKLYLFVGYPGAGKTSVARLIAEHTGAVHMWADNERHAMFAEPTHSAAESAKLYSALNARADQLLAEGKSVLFDTNFNFRKDRAALRRIADARDADTVLIWLTTPIELARKRAVEESHNKEGRVWGNMPAKDFDRLSGNLQPPTDDEHAITIDGTDLSKVDLVQRLGL